MRRTSPPRVIRFGERILLRQGAPFPSDLFTILATLGASMTIGSPAYPGGKRAFPPWAPSTPC